MEQEEKIAEGGFSTELLAKLEEWLAVYDHVYLILGREPERDIYISGILRAGERITKGQRILLLSEDTMMAGGSFSYVQLTEEEQKQFLLLYHMYEFSDRFSVLAKESAYGGLYHLMETGLLSMEEAAEALFVLR